MTSAQHLTWDSRPGADGSTVHLPKYSEVEPAAEPVVEGFRPGPWHFNGRRITTGAFLVADVWNVDEPVGKANARLIAAAPEMYAALMALYAKIPEADVNDRLVEEFLAAEQALIKANGRVYP